jgi:predicted amidophosphoribosyltransferase
MQYMKLFGSVVEGLLALCEFLLDFVLPPGDDLLLVRNIGSAGLVPTMKLRVINAEEYEQNQRALAKHTEINTTPYIKIWALLPYPKRAVKACVRQAKFHTNARAMSLLGEVLADFLHRRVDTRTETITLIPVPLSQERFATRGYNQAEQIIRQALLQLKEKECEGCGPVRVPRFKLNTRYLKRTRNTLPQTTLPHYSRQENVSGAFLCESLRTGKQLYVLVDDVSTTGATFQAAAFALHTAGAKRVVAVALAH